jgi:hypothetical protein
MTVTNPISQKLSSILPLMIFLYLPLLLSAQEADSTTMLSRSDTLTGSPLKDTLTEPAKAVSDSVSFKVFSGEDNPVKEKTTKAERIVYIPDTVYLKNGDKITGKILSFEQGRLCIDGQGMGVIYIKWHNIVSISGGSRRFKVEDLQGVIYIGRIVFSKDTGEIDVQGKLRYGVKLVNVIRIFPLESEWYRGFKGDLGAGVSYTKSSDVLQINTDYNLYYIIKRWRLTNDFSYISTTTGNDSPSIRIEANFQALYSLPHKWVLSEINSFNRNDELGIRARISFGAGAGYNLVQTEKQRLLLQTGVLQNSEKDIESNTYNGNFEWPVTLQHTIYSFLRPNLTSTTAISSYVGVTEAGRYRLDASTDITWEFVINYKLKLSLYYNFDNKTLVGKTSTEDYGTILSLAIQLK